MPTDKMASDNDACTADPNFAIICSFFEKFGKICGVTYPNIQDLQIMLENSAEVHPALVDLHIRLLRKARRTVHQDKWERALVKFMHSYSSQDAWNLERFGYKKTKTAERLIILKNLLELQFDTNTKFKSIVTQSTAQELRLEPIGRDRRGNAYWYQVDEDCNMRVYKEDLDEEIWELVAQNREQLSELITKLDCNNDSSTNTISNEDSNSMATISSLLTAKINEDSKIENGDSKSNLEKPSEDKTEPGEDSEEFLSPDEEDENYFNDQIINDNAKDCVISNTQKSEEEPNCDTEISKSDDLETDTNKRKRSDSLDNEVQEAKKSKITEDINDKIENSDDVLEIGEAIEEPILFVSGQGAGVDCDAANPGDPENSETKLDEGTKNSAEKLNNEIGNIKAHGSNCLDNDKNQMEIGLEDTKLVLEDKKLDIDGIKIGADIKTEDVNCKQDLVNESIANEVLNSKDMVDDVSEKSVTKPLMFFGQPGCLKLNPVMVKTPGHTSFFNSVVFNKQETKSVDEIGDIKNMDKVENVISNHVEENLKQDVSNKITDLETEDKKIENLVTNIIDSKINENLDESVLTENASITDISLNESFLEKSQNMSTSDLVLYEVTSLNLSSKSIDNSKNCSVSEDSKNCGSSLISENLKTECSKIHEDAKCDLLEINKDSSNKEPEMDKPILETTEISADIKKSSENISQVEEMVIDEARKSMETEENLSKENENFEIESSSSLKDEEKMDTEENISQNSMVIDKEQILEITKDNKLYLNVCEESMQEISEVSEIIDGKENEVTSTLENLDAMEMVSDTLNTNEDTENLEESEKMSKLDEIPEGSQENERSDSKSQDNENIVQISENVLKEKEILELDGVSDNSEYIENMSIGKDIIGDTKNVLDEKIQNSEINTSSNFDLEIKPSTEDVKIEAKKLIVENIENTEESDFSKIDEIADTLNESTELIMSTLDQTSKCDLNKSDSIEPIESLENENLSPSSDLENKDVEETKIVEEPENISENLENPEITEKVDEVNLEPEEKSSLENIQEPKSITQDGNTFEENLENEPHKSTEEIITSHQEKDLEKSSIDPEINESGTDDAIENSNSNSELVCDSTEILETNKIEHVSKISICDTENQKIEEGVSETSDIVHNKESSKIIEDKLISVEDGEEKDIPEKIPEDLIIDEKLAQEKVIQNNSLLKLENENCDTKADSNTSQNETELSINQNLEKSISENIDTPKTIDSLREEIIANDSTKNPEAKDSELYTNIENVEKSKIDFINTADVFDKAIVSEKIPESTLINGDLSAEECCDTKFVLSKLPESLVPENSTAALISVVNKSDDRSIEEPCMKKLKIDEFSEEKFVKDIKIAASDQNLEIGNSVSESDLKPTDGFASDLGKIDNLEDVAKVSVLEESKLVSEDKLSLVVDSDVCAAKLSDLNTESKEKTEDLSSKIEDIVHEKEEDFTSKVEDIVHEKQDLTSKIVVEKSKDCGLKVEEIDQENKEESGSKGEDFDQAKTEVLAVKIEEPCPEIKSSDIGKQIQTGSDQKQVEVSDNLKELSEAVVENIDTKEDIDKERETPIKDNLISDLEKQSEEDFGNLEATENNSIKQDIIETSVSGSTEDFDSKNLSEEQKSSEEFQDTVKMEEVKQELKPVENIPVVPSSNEENQKIGDFDMPEYAKTPECSKPNQMGDVNVLDKKIDTEQIQLDEKLDIHNPKLDVHDPKLDINDPKLNILDPKLDTRDPKTDTHDPKSDIHDQKLDLESTDEAKPSIDTKTADTTVEENISDIKEFITNSEFENLETKQEVTEKDIAEIKQSIETQDAIKIEEKPITVHEINLDLKTPNIPQIDKISTIPDVSKSDQMIEHQDIPDDKLIHIITDNVKAPEKSDSSEITIAKVDQLSHEEETETKDISSSDDDNYDHDDNIINDDDDEENIANIPVVDITKDTILAKRIKNSLLLNTIIDDSITKVIDYSKTGDDDTSHDEFPCDDDNSIIDHRQTEAVDPLAGTTDDLVIDDSKLVDSDTIEVKRISDLKIGGNTRKRRISDKVQEDSLESADASSAEEEGAGGKRIKMRGKKVDTSLRQSTEHKKRKQKEQNASSTDDEEESNGDDENDENDENDDELESKQKSKKTKAKKTKADDSSKEDQDKDESKDENTDAKKPRKRTRRIMGLVVEESAILSRSGDPGEPNVRQSRRIAQLKIREEAERRKVEEITLTQLKQAAGGGGCGGAGGKKQRRSKNSDDADFKVEKRKRKQKSESSEYSDDDESSRDAQKKKTKQRGRKKKAPALPSFDEARPWRSSSESSSGTKEEEEDFEHYHSEDERQMVLKSDHEFSPESDLEGEVQPTRRARTVKKDTEEDVDATEYDSHRCQHCGKSDQPQWILLCDSCDCGYHCSCLKPVLLVIPEGDWYCPPCQQKRLITNLQTQLVEYDKLVKKKELEDLRKQRLAYVGISAENVISDEQKIKTENEQRTQDDDASDSSSGSEESSSSGSDSEDDGGYKLRERRDANVSYRFNDYDDLINSAIKDEMDEVKEAAGNMGRGKDISTIIDAEKEERKEADRIAKENAEKTEQIGDSAVLGDNNVTAAAVTSDAAAAVPAETEEKSGSEYDEKEDKPSGKSSSENSSDSEPINPVLSRLIKQKKKTRKLNALDVSSEEDHVSDEDFKGSSPDSEDEDLESNSDLSDSELDLPRKKGATRRSTRARTTRYDKAFINDGSSSSDAPKRKKKFRGILSDEDEESLTSSTEDSDGGWRGRKKKRTPAKKTPKTPKTPAQKGDTSGSPKKRKKRRTGELPDLLFRSGGLGRKPAGAGVGEGEAAGEGEDPAPGAAAGGRRTRGRKINYVEALASDSEDDKKKRKRTPAKRLVSEDEYHPVPLSEEPNQTIASEPKNPGDITVLNTSVEETANKKLKTDETLVTKAKPGRKPGAGRKPKNQTSAVDVPASESQIHLTASDVTTGGTTSSGKPSQMTLSRLQNKVVGNKNYTVSPGPTHRRPMPTIRKPGSVPKMAKMMDGHHPDLIEGARGAGGGEGEGEEEGDESLDEEEDDEDLDEEEFDEEEDSDFLPGAGAGPHHELVGLEEGEGGEEQEERIAQLMMEDPEFAAARLQQVAARIARDKRKRAAEEKRAERERKRTERARKKDEKMRIKEEKAKEREEKKLAKQAALAALVATPVERKKPGRKPKALLQQQQQQQQQQGLMDPNNMMLGSRVPPAPGMAPQGAMPYLPTMGLNPQTAASSALSMMAKSAANAGPGSPRPLAGPGPVSPCTSSSMSSASAPGGASGVSPVPPNFGLSPGRHPMQHPMMTQSAAQRPPQGYPGMAGVQDPQFGGSAPKRRGRGRGKKALAAAEAAAAGQMLRGGAGNKEDDNKIPPGQGAPGISNLSVAAPPQPFSASQPAPSVITRMLLNPGANQPVYPNPGPGLPPQGPGGKYYGHHDAHAQFMQQRPRGAAPGQPGMYRPPGPMSGYPPRPMYHPHPHDPSPSGGGAINLPLPPPSAAGPPPPLRPGTPPKTGQPPPRAPYDYQQPPRHQPPYHQPYPGYHGQGGYHGQPPYQYEGSQAPPPPHPVTQAVSQSVHPGSQPILSVSQPIHSVSQTIHPGSQPIHTVSQPIHPGPQPIHSVTQPIHPGSQPIHSVTQPIHPGPQPLHSMTAQPLSALNAQPGMGVQDESGFENPVSDPVPVSRFEPDNDQDEESGEFGGLVSYFSSQREDDLDT